MNTPWGKSDSIVKLVRGLSWLGTPSHGGFAVSERFARKHLSINAQQRGEFRYGYFFFEEDCDYAIVAWELFGFDKTHVFGLRVREGEQSYTLVDGLGKFDRAALLSTLSNYHADYLVERGIEPDAQGLANYNAHKLNDRMRADKSPDLIVSAVGDWHRDCPKGFVLVTCADDSRWLVKSEEYSNRQPIVTLLSTFTSPISQGRNGEVS